MDDYTKKTKAWLDKRFRKVDENGIYCAHQPIYGYRKGHCDFGPLSRHIVTYQILKALSHTTFNSLLDIGGAEGYKAFLVREIFSIKKVKSCDVSQEACKRAKEIFSIDAEAADIHNLPYHDNEFDIVLCSETLEHVNDIKQATDELLRVCKKAAVITVPHESRETVDKNIREKTPHAHIHSFDIQSYDYLRSKTYNIVAKKMRSSYLKFIFFVVETMPQQYSVGYPKIFFGAYNFLVPFLQKIFGKKMAAFLINLDDCISRFTFLYNSILFIILKDIKFYSKNELKKISARNILDFTVPYHYL